jgi:SulP family sulfate permease
MLRNFFPFLRWFPMRGETVRSDVVAGITVAMVLIPQAMAYAALAGLPVVYGLYASFLPVIVASMWGVSRFLHTGPVAMLSLMSAAAIAPLATQGTEEFIKLSVTLALMVGVLRLALGALRLGVLINFASHPVINGFTNAAALIIGLSLLNTFLNVPMPHSDMFLQDLFNVITQLPQAHLATILFGVGTLITLMLLKRFVPKLPGVLIVVLATTVISHFVGFQKLDEVSLDQIHDETARNTLSDFVNTQQELKQTKLQQDEIRLRIRTLLQRDAHDYAAEAELLRLEGLENSLKRKLYGQRIAVHKIALVQEQDGDTSTYRLHNGDDGWLIDKWRYNGIVDDKIKLSGGGQVVGDIPAGLPSFVVPDMDLGVIWKLFDFALVMALIGFMEATSISRALAAKTREKLNPNQELIGQGLANIVGSFFQSYTVSGSFSRSAVAAKAGASSGFYAVVSAVAVLITMLFFTQYFYDLPKSVLAAIVMSAVFGLIDFKVLTHSWRVSKSDGVVGFITFVATLMMAPQLADGVLVGVILTALVFLLGVMKPRSECVGITEDGTLAGIRGRDLKPISENYIVLRFDAALVFINTAYFEEAVMRAISRYPKAKAVLILGSGINMIDATGEEKLRSLTVDLKAAGITLMLSGLKRQIRDAINRAELDKQIGTENIFPHKGVALPALAQRFDKASGTR